MLGRYFSTLNMSKRRQGYQGRSSFADTTIILSQLIPRVKASINCLSWQQFNAYLRISYFQQEEYYCMSNLLISILILLSIHSIVHMLCYTNHVSQHLSSYDTVFLLIFSLFISIALETNAKIPAVSPKIKRLCEVCRVPKPFDSHHCSRCKRCVYRMDHHCKII